MKQGVACIFLSIAFLFAVSRTELISRRLSFDACQNESWKLTDVTIDSVGSTLTINTDIAYGQGISQTVHKSSIELSGCDAYYRCTNVTRVSVKDLNCNNKTELSPYDAEACEIAMAIGEWETRTGEFSKMWNESGDFDGDLCVVFDEEDVDPDGIENDEATIDEEMENEANRLYSTNIIVVFFSCFILYSVVVH